MAEIHTSSLGPPTAGISPPFSGLHFLGAGPQHGPTAPCPSSSPPPRASLSSFLLPSRQTPAPPAYPGGTDDFFKSNNNIKWCVVMNLLLLSMILHTGHHSTSKKWEHNITITTALYHFTLPVQSNCTIPLHCSRVLCYCTHIFINIPIG